MQLGAGQDGGPPGRQGRKDEVKQRYLGHGQGDVTSRLEGKFTVEGKVPEDRCNQGGKVADPVLKVQDLLKERKHHHLDDAGADGKEREFDGAQKFLL